MSRVTGPTYPDGRPIEPQNLEALTEYAESYRKAEPLPALHQNREDAALGAAWRRCEAALPEGWVLEVHKRPDGCQAETWNFGGGVSKGSHRADGPTPTAALESLADRLEEPDGRG